MSQLQKIDLDCKNRIEQYPLSTAVSFRAFIFVKQRFILKHLAKAGSTVLKRFIMDKLDYSPNIELNYLHSIPDIAAKKSFITKYYCDDSFTKAVLYRDPLSRILSGYLDKCTQLSRKYGFITEDHIEWHIACAPYLEASNYENISFDSFIKWLINNYDMNNQVSLRSINDHFGLAYIWNDFEYFFDSKWTKLDLHNESSWDFIVKKILNGGDDKKWGYMKKKLNLGNKERKNILSLKRGRLVRRNKYKYKGYMDQHTQSADKKVLQYYNNSDTLYLSLSYAWKDFYIFNTAIPEWTCVIILQNQDQTICSFLHGNFVNKTHLLPSCCI